MADSIYRYGVGQTMKGDSALQEAVDDLGLDRNLNLNGYKIINVAPGTNPTDGINVSQLSGGTVTTANNILATDGTNAKAQAIAGQINITNATINMNSHKIINVTNPTNAQDAATKYYVDTSIATAGAIVPSKIVSTDGSSTVQANSSAVSSNQIISYTSAPTFTTGLQIPDKTYVDAGDAATLASANSNTSTAIAAIPKPNQILSNDSSTYAVATNGNIQMNRPLQMQNQAIQNVLDPVNPQDAATKHYVDLGDANTLTAAQNYANGHYQNKIVSADDPTVYFQIQGSTTGNTATTSMNANLDLSSHRALGFLDPIGAQDGVNLRSMNLAIAAFIPTQIADAFGNGLKTGRNATSNGTTYLYSLGANVNLDMESNLLLNVGTPVNPLDATNKTYVDATVNGRYANTTPLNNIVAPTASVSLNSQKIINMANGVLSNDAATYGQLQSATGVIGNTIQDSVALNSSVVAAPTSLISNVKSLSNLMRFQNNSVDVMTLSATAMNLYQPIQVFSTAKQSNLSTLLSGYISGSSAVPTSLMSYWGFYPASLQGNSTTTPNDFRPITVYDQNSALLSYYKITTPLNLLANPTGPLSLGGQAINALLNAPTFTGSISAAEGYATTNANRLTDFNLITSSLNFNSQRGINVANGITAQDITAYGQLTAFQTTVASTYYPKTTTLDAITTAAASVGLGSQKIIGLALGTASTDAANLQNISNAIAAIPAAGVPTKIQNSSTFTFVTTLTDGSIIMAGNNAGVAQTLLIVRNLSGAPTRPELLFIQNPQITLPTTSPLVLWKTASSTCSNVHQVAYNTGTNTNTIRLQDDTTALFGSLFYNSFSTTTSKLTMSTANMQIVLNDGGAASTNSQIFCNGALLAYSTATLTTFPYATAVTATNNVLPLSYNDTRYLARPASVAAPYAITTYGSSGTQVLGSSSIFSEVTGTSLTIPNTLFTPTIALPAGSSASYISMNNGLVIASNSGSGYSWNLGSNSGWQYYSSGGSAHQSSATGGPINGAGLVVQAKIVCIGELDVYSDLNTKHIIDSSSVVTDRAIELISQMDFHCYRYKTYDSGRRIGIIAQELQKIYPDIVSEDEKGLLTVSKAPIFEMTTCVVKHLIKENEALKKRLDRLEKLLLSHVENVSNIEQ